MYNIQPATRAYFYKCMYTLWSVLHQTSRATGPQRGSRVPTLCRWAPVLSPGLGLGGIDSEASYFPDSNETYLGLPPLALFSSGPFRERSVWSQLREGASRGGASLLRGLPTQGLITPHSEESEASAAQPGWLEEGGAMQRVGCIWIHLIRSEE